MKTWDCKIGEVEEGRLPDEADAPMRRAVREAYLKLTGQEPQFIFSGWGGALTPLEREVVGESWRCSFYDITEAMIQHGGGFASQLGRTLRAADEENRKKLADAFSDLLHKYDDFAAKKACTRPTESA